MGNSWPGQAIRLTKVAEEDVHFVRACARSFASHYGGIYHACYLQKNAVAQCLVGIMPSWHRVPGSNASAR